MAWRRLGSPLCSPCSSHGSGAGLAEPVKGEATFSAGGGYARLVLKFSEDVGAEVMTAGSIIVIRFERPVDVSVDRIADAVPDYVGSARRDPGRFGDPAVIGAQGNRQHHDRRRADVRRSAAGLAGAGRRRAFPPRWFANSPSAPGSPSANCASSGRSSEAKKRPPVRVRASVQPTFVRFVFEMPDGVGVSSVLNEQKLKLLFSKALMFDLADAKLAAPPNMASISQKIEGETSVVEIAMVGDVDVHSFREERNYVIDVAFQQAEKPSALPSMADASHPPTRAAPTPAAPAATAPAASDKAMSDKVTSDKAASDKVPVLAGPRRAGEIMSPTPETLAQQAKIEINREPGPKYAGRVGSPNARAPAKGAVGWRSRSAAKGAADCRSRGAAKGAADCRSRGAPTKNAVGCPSRDYRRQGSRRLPQSSSRRKKPIAAPAGPAPSPETKADATRPA